MTSPKIVLSKPERILEFKKNSKDYKEIEPKNKKKNKEVYYEKQY